MTAMGRVDGGETVGVRISDSAEGLADIQSAGCAAAIWNRVLPDELKAWVDALDGECLPKARVVLPPGDIRVVLSQICTLSGTPDDDGRALLINDITALAEIFVGVTRARFLRLRLDVVTSNACRKFHIDAVTSRLICTYRGTGTQYGTGVTGEDPSTIMTVPTGEPIILRGTRWPENPPAGLLHRSPPIEGTGETRLMLVLDPVDDLDDI